MGKKIIKNLKVLLIPVALLVSFLFLGMFGARFLISRTKSVREETVSTQKEKDILEQKASLLKQVQASILPYSEKTYVALPDKNPSLLVLSQLKNQAANLGVGVDSFKLGSRGEEEGVFRIELSFEIAGPLTSILNFLKTVSTIAPLARVDRVSISESEERVDASISIFSFWSDFPTELPKVSEPVVDLTADEKKILFEISKLQGPLFGKLPPTSPTEREDPFSF